MLSLGLTLCKGSDLQMNTQMIQLHHLSLVYWRRRSVSLHRVFKRDVSDNSYLTYIFLSIRGQSEVSTHHSIFFSSPLQIKFVENKVLEEVHFVAISSLWNKRSRFTSFIHYFATNDYSVSNLKRGMFCKKGIYLFLTWNKKERFQQSIKNWIEISTANVHLFQFEISSHARKQRFEGFGM